MNQITTYETTFLADSSKAEQTRSRNGSTGWRKWSSSIMQLNINLGIFFLIGAVLLCFLSTYQKLMIGAPLVIGGYIVPFFFGGLTGICIGYYIIRLRRLNALLSQRMDLLENMLPVCSGCGKVRKPGWKPEEQESWQPMEIYFSTYAGYNFSHGLCPECIHRLYPEEGESILS